MVSTSAHLCCDHKFFGTARTVEELIPSICVLEFGQGYAELLLLVLGLTQGGVVARVIPHLDRVDVLLDAHIWHFTIGYGGVVLAES